MSMLCPGMLIHYIFFRYFFSSFYLECVDKDSTVSITHFKVEGNSSLNLQVLTDRFFFFFLFLNICFRRFMVLNLRFGIQ